MLAAAFLIVALILFILAAIAAFRFPAGQYGLVPAGLAFWVAAEVIKLKLELL